MGAYDAYSGNILDSLMGGIMHILQGVPQLDYAQQVGPAGTAAPTYEQVDKLNQQYFEATGEYLTDQDIRAMLGVRPDSNYSIQDFKDYWAGEAVDSGPANQFFGSDAFRAGARRTGIDQFFGRDDISKGTAANTFLEYQKKVQAANVSKLAKELMGLSGKDIFTPEMIAAMKSNFKGEISGGLKNAERAVQDNLGARGLFGGLSSGAIAQMENDAAKSIGSGYTGIDVSTAEANARQKQFSSQFSAALLPYTTGDAADMGPLVNILNNLGTNLQQTNLFNQSGVQAGIQTTKEDNQRMFENVMSMVGMFKPSGGGGGGGGGDGKFGGSAIFVSYSCVDENCEIETPNGLAPLKFIRLGDQVMGSDGQFHEVVGIDRGDLPEDRQQSYLKFDDGLIITPDHPIEGQPAKNLGGEPVPYRRGMDLELAGCKGYRIGKHNVDSIIATWTESERYILQQKELADESSRGSTDVGATSSIH